VGSSGNEIVNNLSLTKTENMKKVLKSHRAELDFDKKIIMSSITADDFNFEEVCQLDIQTCSIKFG
jgi:hypothetical protein